MSVNQIQIKWKLLATFLFVIAVCVAVASIVTREITIRVFNQHMLGMGQSGMSGMMSSVSGDVQQSLAAALNESLFWGGAAAVAAALFLSFFIARRITSPIKNMAGVTEQVARGDYSRRVNIASGDELGSLAESLNSMAASLEESQRMRRDLMANIAHELRTPLTSISGYMEGFSDGVIEATPAAFELVRGEAARLSRLVDDLSRLSRAESGQELFHITGLPAGQFIGRIGQKLAPQYGDKGVNLDIAVEPGTPPMAADADKMDQVLVNLLDNALRYTEPGGRVSLTASGENGQVDIRVADTGMGISREDLGHIFERFYRADKSRSRAKGGSGIGLTIAKRYVEAMGGDISVVSKEGGGTTFNVKIPSSSAPSH